MASADRVLSGGAGCRRASIQATRRWRSTVLSTTIIPMEKNHPPVLERLEPELGRAEILHHRHRVTPVR